MLIRVWIVGSQPLAGTAAIEGGEPLHFDGWLELLRVVSELVAAGCPGGDASTTDGPDPTGPDADASRPHPESPAC